MSKFSDELLESIQQMDDIYRGEQEPSRLFVVDGSPSPRGEADSNDDLFDTSSTPSKARNEKAL